MIVDRDRARKPLIFIFVFLFLVIVLLMWRSSFMINLFDNFATRFLSQPHSFIWHVILWPAAHLSRPLIIVLFILAIAFYMWGSNFKIPALWFLLTTLTAFPIDALLTLLIHRPALAGRPVSIGKTFPSLPVLLTFLLLQFFFVLLVPEFNKKARKAKNRTITFMIFWLLLVCLSVIAFHYNSVLDVVSALLLGYAWFLFSEEVYFEYAGLFSRLKTFRGSWI
ncbi:MAG: phosphatase PAP2 family protein [Oenococcus sp.]|uniref:phosphatase PAP2 family protein n=1 Tax=Oenococcus sp. TaxID=1979414 RepID=UPI0039ECAC4A